MENQGKLMVYVGTYADEGSESIFLYRLNAETGELHLIKGFKAGKKPSYMAFDKQRRNLYVVNEREEYEGQDSGLVCALSVDAQSGYLTVLNRVPSLGGMPVHIALSENGKVVLVTNYKTGNVAVFPVLEDGKLGNALDLRQHHGSGPNKERQESAHAHYIAFSPEQRFVFVVDLGIDKVIGYRLDEGKGALAESEQSVAFTTEAGNGPRHMCFHPNRRFAYLIHELRPLVTALSYDSDKGTFSEIQVATTIPAHFKGENKCGGIKVTSDGRYLYGSNRGHDSIVVYAIDENSGELTLLQHAASGGKSPREFAISPAGNILLVANRGSNNIVSFKIDAATGLLTPTGHQAALEAPVFVQVLAEI